ncbi:MAG TPA: hypothetical protein VKO61_00470 [Candidatus Paceibacterota bacterium]|nr:hypothetical protein [Candidatus Paceibacterota bacterium]
MIRKALLKIYILFGGGASNPHKSASMFLSYLIALIFFLLGKILKNYIKEGVWIATGIILAIGIFVILQRITKKHIYFAPKEGSVGRKKEGRIIEISKHAVWKSQKEKVFYLK